MKKASIVSLDGEIVGSLNEGDKILRNRSIKHLETTDEWKMESFYKGHVGEIRRVLSDLDTSERAFLFSIAAYVGYEDCCIKHDNGNELSFDDLVVISGLSRSKASETINALLDKDIIYKGKNSKARQYFVNPWIFCKGNRINKVLRTMFRNYRIRVLGNKKWGDVKT
jgi:hypothetical protein